MTLFACERQEAGETQWKYILQFVTSVLTNKDHPIDIVKASLSKMVSGILSAEKATPGSFTEAAIRQLSQFKVLIDLPPPTLDEVKREELVTSLAATDFESNLVHMLNQYPAQGKLLLAAARARYDQNNALGEWKHKFDTAVTMLFQLPHEHLPVIDQVTELTSTLTSVAPPKDDDYWRCLHDDDKKKWVQAKQQGVALVLRTGVGFFLGAMDAWIKSGCLLEGGDTDASMTALSQAFKDRG